MDITLKSNEFSIDTYAQNSDVSNEDINNESTFEFRKDEILGSLSTVKKNINDKDNKIIAIFPRSIFISSDILHSDNIPLNNEIMKTTKISYDFYLSKIMKFLHIADLRRCFNKKTYMSFIVSIIIFFLQPANTADPYEEKEKRFSSLCQKIIMKWLSPYIEGPEKSLYGNMYIGYGDTITLPPEMFETKYLVIIFSTLFIFLFIMVKNNIKEYNHSFF
ncbi:hypothetical protein PRELSG_0005250 [Plasmodium relictum]|uniref:Uncharacterized protein n=1 Tax=Plasmodium relictum TaxID=85471 RepID=A0A1J1GKI1_PLARL|nr:hypothetical protein PRELSG_0005250 [Plasmodium relictum]CRG85127.1 hypothetical protein PRELSG_0005250 [Plasmodium relictum]